MFATAGAADAFCAARAIAGAQPPALPLVALAWPLQAGTFLAVNGGSHLSINAHLMTLVGDTRVKLP